MEAVVFAQRRPRIAHVGVELRIRWIKVEVVAFRFDYLHVIGVSTVGKQTLADDNIRQHCASALAISRKIVAKIPTCGEWIQIVLDEFAYLMNDVGGRSQSQRNLPILMLAQLRQEATDDFPRERLMHSLRLKIAELDQQALTQVTGADADRFHSL